jgi:hypothetical protein
MQVTFTKASHRKDTPPWVAVKGKSRIVGSHLGADPRHLGHDIVTLVVERELRIDDGFFASVAGGGTFRSMRKRRTSAGKAAIARNRAGINEAEQVVHRHWDAWLKGEPTPCAASLEAAWVAWQAVPAGGTITLDWPDQLRQPVRPSGRERVTSRR